MRVGDFNLLFDKMVFMSVSSLSKREREREREREIQFQCNNEDNQSDEVKMYYKIDLWKQYVSFLSVCCSVFYFHVLNSFKTRWANCIMMKCLV